MASNSVSRGPPTSRWPNIPPDGSPPARTSTPPARSVAAARPPAAPKIKRPQPPPAQFFPSRFAPVKATAAPIPNAPPPAPAPPSGPARTLSSAAPPIPATTSASITPPAPAPASAPAATSGPNPTLSSPPPIADPHPGAFVATPPTPLGSPRNGGWNPPTTGAPTIAAPPSTIATEKPTFENTSPNDPITLATFRCLLGIPQDCPPLPRYPDNPYPWHRTGLCLPVRRPTCMPKWLKMQSCHPEAATSTYFEILKQEQHTWRRYYFYEWIMYSFMITQLMIASVLIILGAMNRANHIPVAVLGAVTGILTGILSLIRGQGLPNRLLQYADQLRRVREDIEFSERVLRTNSGTVTSDDVVKLRQAYEMCRDDNVKNHPDSWTSGLSPLVGTKSSTAPAELAV